MNNEERKKYVKPGSIAISIVLIIVGIVFVGWPVFVASFICTIVGIAAIIMGAGFIIDFARRDAKDLISNNNLAVGAFAVALGIFILARADLVITFVPIIIGFIVLVSGFTKIQNALTMIKMGNNGWPLFIIAAINIALGILLIVNIWAQMLIYVILGIALMYTGVSDLITKLLYAKTVKNYESDETIINSSKASAERDEEVKAAVDAATAEPEVEVVTGEVVNEENANN